MYFFLSNKSIRQSWSICMIDVWINENILFTSIPPLHPSTQTVAEKVTSITAAAHLHGTKDRKKSIAFSFLPNLRTRMSFRNLCLFACAQGNHREAIIPHDLILVSQRNSSARHESSAVLSLLLCSVLHFSLSRSCRSYESWRSNTKPPSLHHLSVLAAPFFTAFQVLLARLPVSN